FPVFPTGIYSDRTNPITYTQGTPDTVLNRGLPPSFSFLPDDFLGTESDFRPKPGATVFYLSVGGTNSAGVVGWQSGLGRVIQFSSLFGSKQIEDNNSARLLANAVSWAANIPLTVSKLRFEPATIKAGASLTADFSGTLIDQNAYLDIRFRSP